MPRTTVLRDPAAEDESLRTARDAVLTGAGWRPAAELLATTGPDPEPRGRRVFALADAVARDDSWSDHWLAARPLDADAVVVRAWGEIARAWLARSNNPTVFPHRLARAEPWCERAIDAAPHDPVALVPALWLAVGQAAPRAVFHRRWERLEAVDLHSRLGHTAAIQYWGQHGTAAETRAFADRAAGLAPDTWATVVPVEAHIEVAHAMRRGSVRGEIDAARFWRNDPQVRADLDTALRWTRSVPSSAATRHDLGVVAYALARARRYLEARDVLARLDWTVVPHPWDGELGGAELTVRLIAAEIRWSLWEDGLD